MANAHERLAATGAGHMVLRFRLCAVIGLPPCRSALVRAELAWSVFFLYLNGSSALFAHWLNLTGITGNSRSAAVGFYRALRDSE